MKGLSQLFKGPASDDLTQRRQERRFTCYVPVLCTTGSRTDTAVIVDFARGGLRLLMSHATKRGTTVRLHYNSDPAALVTPPVTARVMWTRRRGDRHEVGVQCQSSQLFWVQGLLRTMEATTDSTDVRRTLRFSTGLAASVRALQGLPQGEKDAGNPAVGQLVDLSLGGAAFCGALAGPVGSAVSVSIQPDKGRTMTLAGRIVNQVRQDDARYRLGICFENVTPGARDELARLLRSLSKIR